MDLVSREKEGRPRAHGEELLMQWAESSARGCKLQDRWHFRSVPLAAMGVGLDRGESRDKEIS